MTTNVRLFLMMVLQLAIWGAWAPKLFPYMTMLGFEPWQQSLVGSSWGVAAHAGLDVAVTDKSALRFDVRWADIDSKVKLDGAKIGTANIDPMVYGVAYVMKF